MQTQSHLLVISNRQLVFFSDLLANLTVFQQIGGFNIRLVDFQSQMFFVGKNGLQCLKFVCDPHQIIGVWDCRYSGAPGAICSRSPARSRFQFMVKDQAFCYRWTVDSSDFYDGLLWFGKRTSQIITLFSFQIIAGRSFQMRTKLWKHLRFLFQLSQHLSHIGQQRW